MNIDIKDYLNEEEIKEIIKNAITIEVKNRLYTEKEITRILTNISYYELWRAIEEEVPNCRELIKEKIKEKITTIEKYDIFRKADNFIEKEDSYALKILNECVSENKNIINNKVRNIMNELSLTDLKYEINDILETYIENLFKNKEE